MFQRKLRAQQVAPQANPRTTTRRRTSSTRSQVHAQTALKSSCTVIDSVWKRTPHRCVTSNEAKCHTSVTRLPGYAPRCPCLLWRKASTGAFWTRHEHVPSNETSAHALQNTTQNTSRRVYMESFILKVSQFQVRVFGYASRV